MSTPANTSITKAVRRRIPYPCSSLNYVPSKAYSTPPASQVDRQDTSQLYSNQGRELREGPRWDATPPRMTAPVRSKPPARNNEFVVNQDPEKLDRVYNRVLGTRGDEMLTDEVKWLAITHKSFDHGRRGYNDRLSYLGKRIIELQTSLTLLNTSRAPTTPPAPDQFGRQPFSHPALQGLNDLTPQAKRMTLDKKRVAQLAERYGLKDVIRWKPKRSSNLQGSGLPIVLVQALYAIVGAVALQRGGEVANGVVKGRILNPLGLQ